MVLLGLSSVNNGLVQFLVCLFHSTYITLALIVFFFFLITCKLQVICSILILVISWVGIQNHYPRP